MRQLVVWGELGYGVRKVVEDEGRVGLFTEPQQLVEGES